MVITCSDTRTKRTDQTGKLIVDLLQVYSHPVLGHHIVRDEAHQLTSVLMQAVQEKHVRVVIINGGTGITERDRTVEVVEALLEKKLSGFGELFRTLSYEKIGSSAMLSRAVAGTFRGRMIFALPGSESAARLAMEELILPELGHIAFLLGKQD